MYFNVNFNAFFKSIKMLLLVSELYIYQNARCNDKNTLEVYLVASCILNLVKQIGGRIIITRFNLLKVPY